MMDIQRSSWRSDEPVLSIVLIISCISLILFAYTAFPYHVFLRGVSVPLSYGDLSLSKRREKYRKEAKQIYQDGYNKFKNTMGFRVTSTDEVGEKLILSPKYLPELRKLPDSVLSFEAALENLFEKKYLGVPADHSINITPRIIKADLTPALTRLNPVLSAEVDHTVISEFGDCDDWTLVNINQTLLRIVAIVSGRIFIGPELCHDERYIDASINYTIEITDAQRALKGLHPLLKHFQGHKLPSVLAIRKREADFRAFIASTVLARKTAINAGEEVPDDMLTWVIKGAENEGVSDNDLLADIQLNVSFAAIHTTTLTATNVFYNLAAYPESMKPLRDEIRQVLEEFDGVFTFSALQRLRKLDSFIKESLRMHPTSFVSMMRKVMQPFHLSTGELIHAGTMIEVPAHAISRDPDIYPDPDTFKPWRFSDLRDEGEAGAARYQFVSVTQELMTFGYGRHACPGRFFAANEIKMIVAKAISNYDIRLKDGETERYKNLEFDVNCVPDPSKELLFKRVEV